MLCIFLTEFKNNLILAKNKKGREELKPEPIENYNKFMSGIDRQDQMNRSSIFEKNHSLVREERNACDPNAIIKFLQFVRSITSQI